MSQNTQQTPKGKIATLVEVTRQIGVRKTISMTLTYWRQSLVTRLRGTGS
jgi:hypothetical protein